MDGKILIKVILVSCYLHKSVSEFHKSVSEYLPYDIKKLFLTECGGLRYDPETEECCGGRNIVDRGACHVGYCPGKVMYYTDMEHCCGSKPKPITESCEKCGNKFYNPLSQKCCNGDTIISYMFSCRDVKYCNNTGYLELFDVCCKDRIVKFHDCKKCGKANYLPDYHICCRENEAVFDKSSSIPDLACTCNGKSYDPKVNECCVYGIEDTKECEVRHCPHSRKKYFPLYEKCCQFEIRNKFLACYPCGGKLYKYIVEECCEGKVVPRGECTTEK